MKLTEYTKLDPAEVQLDVACGKLRAGAEGTEQPPGVKGRLREMERLGLAEYSSRGWHLTDTGKRRAARGNRMAAALRRASS